MSTNHVPGALSSTLLEDFAKDFRRRPENRLAMNAATRTNLQEVAINRQALNQLNLNCSIELQVGGPITDQKRASTCWLFADVNWLRQFVLKKANIEAFEFSENHAFFWDKLEKCNYFLEKIIEHRSKPWDDRLIMHMMTNPCPDGGEWHMLANVIEKYGMIPKTVMPDTWNRENSRFVNEILYYKLREGAAMIRTLHRQGKPVVALRKVKDEVMKVAYRVLVIMLGTPPKKFDWVFKDKKKKTHVERDITPKQWYRKYVGVPPKSVYTLLSCPLDDTPYNQTFTAEYFNNVIEGEDYLCLNVPLDVLKQKAIQQLKAGEAVLFGADVVQNSHSKDGLLDSSVFNYELFFGTNFDMDRRSRLMTGQERMTHAMVFIGVDMKNGQPLKWKVENSWGEEAGKKGIFVMSDSWFEEHLYDLVLRKKFISQTMLEQLKQKPIKLPAWHPMV